MTTQMDEQHTTPDALLARMEAKGREVEQYYPHETPLTAQVRLNLVDFYALIALAAENALLRQRVAVLEGAVAPFKNFEFVGFDGPMVEISQPDAGNPSPRIAPFELKHLRRLAALAQALETENE